jgi:PAS domain S-box-containing protein
VSTRDLTKQALHAEMIDLRARLAEAEETLRAIRDYEVDALVVQAPDGDRVYALELADQAYRQMVEQMNEGAVTLSLEGTVLFANQPLARLLLRPVGELVGQGFQEWLPAVDRAHVLALLGDPAGGRVAGHVRLPDGRHLPVAFSASRVVLETEPAVLLLITDLTNEEQADRVTRLLQLSTRLAVAVTPAQVGEVIVHGALQVFDGFCGFLAVPADRGGWSLAHCVGYSTERVAALAPLLSGANSPTAEALRLGGLLIAANLAERQTRFPNWPTPVSGGPLGALLTVVLQLPDRVMGVLHVDFAGEWAAEADDRDFVLTVAQQCAQAQERAALYGVLEQRIQERTEALQAANRRLQNEMAERRTMQRQLDRAREIERQRIARELHDELGGDLTALKMDVSRIRRAPGLPAKALADLTNLSRAIEGTINSVRRLSTELRPQILDDLGLVPALEAYFQDFLKRSGLTGDLICAMPEERLQGEAATACFRIVQEALTNVLRHAQASRVTVRLEPAGAGVRLEITDDGRGMRPEDRAAPGHLGLVGIQERADMLAAELDIISAPGDGTTIRVLIPLAPA